LLAGQGETPQQHFVKLRTALTTFIAALFVGWSASAWADCTQPAAHHGAQMYAADYGVTVYCNGTAWMFVGVTFSEVIDQVLFAFAPSEALAADIEERFALHLSVVAGQITGLPVTFVQVLPAELHR
jgi:Sec-independent protein secretion pathway component TatC